METTPESDDSIFVLDFVLYWINCVGDCDLTGCLRQALSGRLPMTSCATFGMDAQAGFTKYETALVGRLYADQNNRLVYVVRARPSYLQAKKSLGRESMDVPPINLHSYFRTL